MFYQLEHHISLLENFIQSNNKSLFIDQLNNPTEKMFLKLLIADVDDIQTYKKQLGKLEVGFNLRNAILKYKLQNHVQEVTTKLSQKLLKELKHHFASSVNFNYEKPANIRREEMVNENEDISARIGILSKKPKIYLNQKVSEDNSFIFTLDPMAITSLTEQTLMKLEFKVKDRLIRENQFLIGINPNTLEKIFTSYFLEYKNYNRRSESLDSFNFPYSKLNKQQLIALSKNKKHEDIFHNPLFCQQWLSQHYRHFIEEYSQVSTQSMERERYFLPKLQIVKDELMKHSKSFPFKMFQFGVLTEILATEIELGSVHEIRLTQYLNSEFIHLSYFGHYTQKFRSKLNKKGAIERCKIQSVATLLKMTTLKLRGSYKGASVLIEQYLLQLFKHTDPSKMKVMLQRLGQMIEMSFLKKLEVKVKLMKGQKCEDATDYWVHKELVEFREKKELKLSQRNQKIFKAQDEIVINLILKNVKEVQIKIYELNLLKEYLTNNSASNRNYDDINLSYFSPSSTQIFTNPSDNPFELKQIKINLELIPKRLGIFVVDLQGEGITSRAVIRKGSIICLQKYSVQGQFFQFFDEGGNLLTEKDGLCVWVDKHQVALTEDSCFDSSSIEIDKRQANTEIIANMGCYAQKFNKSTLRNYRLGIKAIYNCESFITQNKAKLLLNANLTMNSQLISLSKLKNIRVTVNQLTGNVITSSNTYEFKQWQDNRQQIVEFFPQDDISSISVQMRGEVDDLKNCQVQSNSLSISITSSNKNQQIAIVQPYLKQESNQNYQFTLKGKNGQGIPHKQVNLSFDMKGTSSQQKFKFITDKEGNISLGKLSAVRKVLYSVPPITRTWSVDKVHQNFSIWSIIYAFPGEQVVIPIDSSLTVNDILLHHFVADRSEKNDVTETVTVKQGLLSFTTSLVKQSSYTLSLLPIEKKINIDVVSNGSKWEKKYARNDILVDALEGKVLKIRRNTALRNVSIGEVNFKPSQNNNTQCLINLINHEHLTKEQAQKVRVHVLATNYLTPNIYGGLKIDSKQENLFEQCRQLNKSTYLSNKTLSEESAYIFNRQKEKTRIGSNLQKPGIFLQRLSVRQTQNVVGDLNKEGNFEVNRHEVSKRKAFDNMRGKGSEYNEGCITKHNSFLSLSGFVCKNMGSKALIEIPNGYSHIEVFLITPQHVTKATFPLESQTNRVKDIRYKGLAKCNEGNSWNISRQIYNIKQQNKLSFNKKCQHKAVTLKEVFEYAQKIIFAGGSQKLYSWKDNFILWHGFSQEQKLKIYNKYFCHEINTFIKFKDQPFFKSTVAPFIHNKLNKSFIDLCLIQSHQICQYLTISKLLLLNNFECTLFVYVLVKINRKQDAKRVVERMQLSFQKDLPYKVKSSSFDFIINSFVGKEAVIPQRQERKNENKDKKKKKRRSRSRSLIASVCQDVGIKMKGQQRQLSQSESQSEFQSEGEEIEDDEDCDSSQDQPKMRMRKLSQRSCKRVNPKKKNEVQSTRECTEQTYYYEQYQRYPQHQKKPFTSPFWPELAQHFLQGGNGHFTSASFTQLKYGLEVMLAAAFIPGKESNTLTLEDEGEKYSLKANVGLSVFVKEQKEYPIKQKDGVYIYQTISTKSTLEPNKEIIASQIRAGQPYFLSTIFSNSTSNFLDLQILCPIPEGSVPLRSKEVTIIQNNLGPFKTDIHKQSIYFPAPGMYKLPPANILDMNSGNIISHSPANLPLSVIKSNQGKKLESFEDIIQYGSKTQILDFLKTKNIFSADVFKPELILWMLRDDKFFDKVINTLRHRFYYEAEIWKFSLLHGHKQALAEYLNLKKMQSNPLLVNIERINSIGSEPFEYHPYFQKRTHRYANQNRSAIKNADLKQTYINFLLSMSISTSYTLPNHKLAHAYYLILQDRLLEAQKIVNDLTTKEKELCQLQMDYIRCYLDMGLNGQNCQIAKSIAPKYQEYPIVAWRKLFSQIIETLKEPPVNQFQSKQTLQTKVIKLENGDLSIHRSTKKSIKIQIFPTNMQLFFTQHSFDFKQSISNFSISKPTKQILIDTTNKDSQIIIKRQEFKEISNPYIEISEHGNHSHKKIKSLIWSDPLVIAKLHEQEGVIQVFVDGKRAPGSYVKVFTTRKGLKRPTTESRYYVDGYTDIAGKFRYALTDLQQIEEFALLVITDKGAIVKYVNPPRASGEESKHRKGSSSSDFDSDLS